MSMLALGACSDMTAPNSSGIDQSAVSDVMPALTDARVRISTGLRTIAVRQKVTLALADLDFALRTGNRQTALTDVRSLTSTLNDYRSQVISDGADVTAIMLMLQAVSRIVDPTNPTQV